jgi:hypothetical protein
MPRGTKDKNSQFLTSARERIQFMSKHRRAPEANEKRLARRILRSIVLERGFHDVERCETVCLLTCVELIGLAGPKVGVCDVPDVERGEVLVDSRGQGSFQR